MHPDHQKIERREFLKLFGLGGMLLTSNGLACAKNRMTKKPNVLFIICDDLNDWILYPPGHPKPRTPNMDRLRQRSVNFANAHAVVPVCGPARRILFSGLYPQTQNNYGFARWQDVPLLQECVPLPLHFRNNGYDVYGTGKLFHEGAGGDFYTAYGNGPDYGPWPWKGIGRPKYTAHPAQYKLWIRFLPLPLHALWKW